MSSPGPESPLVLTLRGVSKAFGAVQALRDVSVDCRAGEIHALVGENGSGKSTLLGIASGFVDPDEGAVEIGGQRRRRGSPAEARRLGLGIAYQTYSHVLDLSVAENLYLAVPAEREAEVRADGGVGGGEARRVRARRPADGGRGVAVARRAAAARGRQGPARQAEGAPPRRADDRARAGRRRAASRAGVRAKPGRRRRRLRQPSTAGGARHRRPHHRSSRRCLPGDVRRGRRCRRKASSR